MERRTAHDRWLTSLAAIALVAPLLASGIDFVLEPMTRFPGAPGEQATMFVLDLSDNALEFKSFRHPEHVFTA